MVSSQVIRAWKQKCKAVATQLLDVPPDVTEDLPRVVMYGNERICIENIKDILFFSDQHVKLKIAEGYIEISGTVLLILSLTHAEIVVSGIVNKVEYFKT